MYEAHREYFGNDDPGVLVWQGETRRMNPTISEGLVRRELERDPDSASAEWLARFRADLESAFSVEAVRACIVPGRDELPPSSAISYRCFVDPSGGRHDSFTLAISHRGKDVAMLDAIHEWRAPFDPSVVVKEASDIARKYRCSKITGDNYSAEWTAEAFKKHRITYEKSEKNKSELYLAMIPAVNSKQVELLDHPRLLEQLRRLERRKGRTGRDSIDHPPRLSDDVANAVAGAIGLATKGPIGAHGFPIGVGRGLGAEMRKSFGPLVMDQPVSGGPFPEEQRPGKGCAVLYRFGWGEDNSEDPEPGGYVSRTGRRKKFPSIE